nr:hypothetical protein [Streptomyces apricus]
MTGVSTRMAGMLSRTGTERVRGRTAFPAVREASGDGPGALSPRVVGPPELGDAFARLARRYADAAAGTPLTDR